MPRDSKVYLEDILAASARIRSYVGVMALDDFRRDGTTRLVWVIDPTNSRAVVYRSLIEVRRIGLEDYLEGGEVVPGFRCRLREIL